VPTLSEFTIRPGRQLEKQEKTSETTTWNNKETSNGRYWFNCQTIGFMNIDQTMGSLLFEAIKKGFYRVGGI
jgi:hypothetical protein